MNIQRAFPLVVLAVLAVTVGTGTLACSTSANGVPQVQIYGYDIINEYPHDPSAYTQGLSFENGALFEGTGRYSQSSLRRVELETGRVLQQVDLPAFLFGEGIAALGDRIYQLTWVSGFGFIYDRDTFERQGQFGFEPEGWGLTHDGEHLIMSDGSAFLRFFDPDSLDEVRRIQVHDASGPVDQLNELEVMREQIWANVWHSDEIIEIDPESGAVVGRLDLSDLLAGRRPRDPEGVLNGIAYDPYGDRTFVTGKLWSRLFEIRLTR